MAYLKDLIVILTLVYTSAAFKVDWKRSRFPMLPGDNEIEPSPKVWFESGNIPAEDRIVNLGDNVVFDCEATGSPTPTLHWLFKGKRITQGGNHITVKDDEAAYETNKAGKATTIGLGSTKSRLYIDCVTEHDLGVYTCVADIPTKRIITKSRLAKPEEFEQRPEESQFLPACMMKRLESGSPARVYMWTAQRIEVQGADVQLFCRAAGDPQPKVTWIGKDGHEITSEDQGYRLLENGDLLIRNANFLQHMGLFKCEAQNEYGENTVSTFFYPTAP